MYRLLKFIVDSKKGVAIFQWRKNNFPTTTALSNKTVKTVYRQLRFHYFNGWFILTSISRREELPQTSLPVKINQQSQIQSKSC